MYTSRRLGKPTRDVGSLDRPNNGCVLLLKLHLISVNLFLLEVSWLRIPLNDFSGRLEIET